MPHHLSARFYFEGIMALNEKDIEDLKLARPVAVVDLWSIDDRVNRLEGITERLESIIIEQARHIRSLVTLYHEERVKNWELIINEMVKEQDRKNERYKKYKT